MRDLTPSDPVRVGPFRILGRLGAGGMGLIYAGQDSTGRRVAVKVVQPQLTHDSAFLARFAREAILLGRVDGACTARVLAADVDADPPYLALEYVDGPTLGEHVEAHGPMPAELLLPLAVGLAEALTAIHAVGVVHRDLKPANVVLGATGPKVIDFGIAYLSDATSLTSSGLVLGSPGWMAPEQFAADEISPASDVFAWASTVLFAATGKAPFGSGSVEAVYYRILNSEPDLSSVAAPLRDVLAQALAKNPAERPSPRQLIEQLSGVTSSDVTDQTTMLMRASWTFQPAVSEWDPRLAATTPIPPADQETAALTSAAPPAPVNHRRRTAVIAAVAAIVLGTSAGVYALNHAAAGPEQTVGKQSALSTSALTSPSATASPSPSASPAAMLPSAPKAPFFKSNPVCSGLACTLLGAVGGIRTSRGVLRAEIIRLPMPVGADITTGSVYIALYDTAGQLVYTTPRALIGAYQEPDPAYPDTGISTDKAGRIFVPFTVGAHSGQLIVLDPNQRPVNVFGSIPQQDGSGGRFFSDTPGAFGTDVNGDGINEVVLDVNDYIPNYAQGTTYARYYGYQRDDFVLIGCTKLGENTNQDAPPAVPVGGPGCEAG